MGGISPSWGSWDGRDGGSVFIRVKATDSFAELVGLQTPQ